MKDLRKFMIIDMSFVSGLDSTTSYAMHNLQNKVRNKYQVELMFAGCVKETVQEQLLASGIDAEAIFRVSPVILVKPYLSLSTTIFFPRKKPKF